MKSMHQPHVGLRGACLVMGLLIASCIPTRKDEELAGSGTEMGNVVGSIYTADSLPAAGITVTLYPVNPEIAGIRTAVTDADGLYDFHGVQGDYSLLALDGAGNALRVDSILADTASPVDLERRNLSPVAAVSGFAKVIGVRPADSSAPKVEMYLDSSPFRIEVEPNTGFHWPDLPAGRYWLILTYSWAETVTLPITLESGQTLDLDTVTLINEFSTGIGSRDTLKVTAAELPLRFWPKLATHIGEVDSVLWVLNGAKLASNRSGRYMDFALKAGDLRDTGDNVLEMRLYLPDTTVIRAWYIEFDGSPVLPWARQAVKGIFMGSEVNPSPNSEGMKLGTFRILERRLLDEAEMSFWGWAPVPGGDTALPDLIKAPMSFFEVGIPFGCGEMVYGAEPELFPGDTVTLFTAPDSLSGGRTLRIRKDEPYASFANLAWFPGAAWPLAEMHAGALKGGQRDIRIGVAALKVRLERNYRGPAGGANGCIPMSRGFTVGADGIPREYVATPEGMSPGNLLLHFRAGLPGGLFTEALASSGDYVFLDSAGRGVAGSGSDRRDIQLSSAQVSELQALLAGIPADLPIEWDQDYLADSLAEPRTTNYLLSGGRGALLAAEPRSQPVPQAKLDLFNAVEAWLRGHDLL